MENNEEYSNKNNDILYKTNFKESFEKISIYSTQYPFYYKCLKCFDCPRIIFEHEGNKMVITAFCYFHKNDKRTYTLSEFMDEFQITKNKENEIIKEKKKIKISQILRKPIELDSSFNQSSFKLSNDINYIEKQEKNNLRNKTQYCLIHNNSYTMFSEFDDLPICNYCYCEIFREQNRIQKYVPGKRYEIISNLISKVNKKLNYIKENIEKAKEHIEKIKQIAINDKETNESINEYINENENLLKIALIILNTYNNAYIENSITYSIVKNISELIFYYEPIPEKNKKKEKYKTDLIEYLQNPNNYILNYHLKIKKSFNPLKLRVTKVLKLLDNRLCIGINNIIYILKANLDFSFTIKNDLTHKNIICDMQLLSNGTLVSISNDNICCFIKLYENGWELIGQIIHQVENKEYFNSFLILSDNDIVIHTSHYLLIYKIPKNIKEKSKLIIKKEYIDIKLVVYAGLILRQKNENLISFFSIISGYNMVIPWEFNIETETINEPFNFNYECKIQYSHYSGSICKLNENYFIVGGFANFGFYLIKYSDGKLYTNCIPNNNHFQGICVLPDNTFICGENYANNQFLLRRYQMIDDDYILIDIISNGYEKNSLKGNPMSIIYLDNSTIVVGDYNGTISIWE